MADSTSGEGSSNNNNPERVNQPLTIPPFQERLGGRYSDTDDVQESGSNVEPAQEQDSPASPPPVTSNGLQLQPVAAVESGNVGEEVHDDDVADDGENVDVDVDERYPMSFARLRRLAEVPPDPLVAPYVNVGDGAAHAHSSSSKRRFESDSSSSGDEISNVHLFERDQYVTLSSDSEDSDEDDRRATELFAALRERKEAESSLNVPAATSASKPIVNPAMVFDYFKKKDNLTPTIPPYKKQKMETEIKKLQRPSHLELCQKCSKPGDYVCKGCYRVSYCTKEHQNDDWSLHQRSCLHFGLEFSPAVLYRGPFKIHSDIETPSSPFQNYTMKAKVTIPEKNQVIVEEKPFLLCPWPRSKIRQDEQAPTRGLLVRNLSCFGCGKVLGFSSVRCSECDLFLCSDNCPFLECHRECECKFIQQQLETGKTAKSNDSRLNAKNIFANDQNREWIYLDVMMLRLLKKISDMQKSMSQEKFQLEWATLNAVWKCCDAMVDTDRRENVRKNLESYLKFSYTATNGNFDMVWNLFCILDMNSFVLELPFKRFKVLCSVVGMAAHSCNPNSVALLKESDMDNIDISQPETHPDDLTIVLKSGQTIASGVTITFPYIPLVMATEERRTALYNNYLFFCTCARCMDPTELGTYSSHVRCLTCNTGVLTPSKEAVNVYSMSTYKQKWSDWECRLPNSSGKMGCRRGSPIIAHQDMMAKIRSTEANSIRYLVNPSKAKSHLSHRPDNMGCYSSVTLKVCEDILRGTFYPLPDVLADDLKDFSDDALLCIVLARNMYRDFMKKIHPGFNFEGYPVANHELAENELRGRETGQATLREVDRYERRPPAPPRAYLSSMSMAGSLREQYQ